MQDIKQTIAVLDGKNKGNRKKFEHERDLILSEKGQGRYYYYYNNNNIYLFIYIEQAQFNEKMGLMKKRVRQLEKENNDYKEESKQK